MGQSVNLRWVETHPIYSQLDSINMGLSTNQLRMCHFLQGIWLISHGWMRYMGLVDGVIHPQMVL